MTPVTYTAHPAPIVFGHGTIESVADQVGRLGRSRVLVLRSPELSLSGDRIEKQRGPLAVGRFDGRRCTPRCPSPEQRSRCSAAAG